MISINWANIKNVQADHCWAVANYCASNRRKYQKTNLDSLVSTYFSPVVANFDELISAPPELLAKIKTKYDGFNNAKKTMVLWDLDLTGLYGYFINEPDKFQDSLGQDRKRKGLTVAKFAREAFLETSNVAKIEGGSANLTLWSMIKISKALGVSLSELIDDFDHTK